MPLSQVLHEQKNSFVTPVGRCFREAWRCGPRCHASLKLQASPPAVPPSSCTALCMRARHATPQTRRCITTATRQHDAIRIPPKGPSRFQSSMSETPSVGRQYTMGVTVPPMSLCPCRSGALRNWPVKSEAAVWRASRPRLRPPLSVNRPHVNAASQSRHKHYNTP